jgi:DNA topoisomerase-1
MSYELIISEKPQAAAKIAAALADSSPKKVRDGKVNYFVLTHKGKNIRVASAVGHLYGLSEKGGESWTYPVFDTEWKPIYKNNKQALYTKDYLNTLIKLGKEADEITIATDFDIEGEVIGLNIVRFALKKKDANRMKFSTLTKKDLIKAYENKQKHLEWGQANAGETRHTLDWYYGINLSRAFTESIKKGANQFKVLSTGRVQAPALHFLAQRERKIKAFEPETFWEIYLDGESKKISFKAQYELPKEIAEKYKKEREKRLAEYYKDIDDEDQKISLDKFKVFDKELVDKIISETKNKNGIIKDIVSKRFKQKAPTPFDLTSLQMEASTMLNFSPKKTLELAQKLYIEGVTSYPRTSSQKLPKELDLKDKLMKLAKQPHYKDKVDLVLKVNPSIKPNEGKKDDPAHPAIHPTGEIPKNLGKDEMKLYDLIVKRFFAIFGKDAIRESQTITIDINNHNFILKGTKTIEKNWQELYEPYLKFEEVELPHLSKGDEVINKSIEKIEKKTSPPKRYTDASIIKELEKRNLGTKATRAEILNNLRERGYITGKSIEVTELGLKMDEVLSSEIPDLVKEELTREFEEEMEKIREEKSSPEKVLEKAKEKLNKILTDIKNREIELGKKLAKASNLALKQAITVGKCPVCKKGNLVIRTANKTKQKFIGCDRYPECKTIFSLPNVKIVKPLYDGDNIDEEGRIFVLVGNNERNMRKICINCQEEEKEQLLEDEKKYPEIGMVCPVCKKGHMKLRKSYYGEFLGCDNYPNCKTMMRIVNGKVDTKNIITQNNKSKK